MKTKLIHPAETKEERLKQYTGALIECDRKSWTINDLGLRGPVWTSVTRTLINAGIIKRAHGYSPVQYTLIKTKGNLKKWIGEQ